MRGAWIFGFALLNVAHARLPSGVAELSCYGNKPGAQGSGAIVKAANGGLFLVTVAHVIDGYSHIDYYFDQGAFGGRSGTIDLRNAVITRARGSDLRYIRLRRDPTYSAVALPLISRPPATLVKTHVRAFGFPHGFPSSRNGQVVARFDSAAHGHEYLIADKASELNGMSGGPVINDQGFVIGAVDSSVVQTLIGFSPVGP